MKTENCSGEKLLDLGGGGGLADVAIYLRILFNGQKLMIGQHGSLKDTGFYSTESNQGVKRKDVLIYMTRGYIDWSGLCYMHHAMIVHQNHA